MSTGYRSRTSTHGRNMAGARSLWRATGMTDADFGKPIIAIANSFTQFVPGHVHLHDVGQRVKTVVDATGGWGVEFNTIAVDDGIAMGHGDAVIDRDGVELHPPAACGVHHSFYALAHIVKVHVAGHELGEAVGDGDYRLAEVGVRHAGRAPE